MPNAACSRVPSKPVWGVWAFMPPPWTLFYDFLMWIHCHYHMQKSFRKTSSWHAYLKCCRVCDIENSCFEVLTSKVQVLYSCIMSPAMDLLPPVKQDMSPTQRSVHIFKIYFEHSLHFPSSHILSVKECWKVVELRQNKSGILCFLERWMLAFTLTSQKSILFSKDIILAFIYTPSSPYFEKISDFLKWMHTIIVEEAKHSPE